MSKSSVVNTVVGVGGRGIRSIYKANDVLEGGGFKVRRAFPINKIGSLDPFLLLDHMSPSYNEPGEAIGAPDHPHRGFETVTYLLQGSMQHLDSYGHKGVIKAGGVQWMTAGSGLIHSEMPGDDLLVNGGWLEGFQIWVDLPRSHKMTAPHYQELDPDQIPQAKTEDGRVTVKVISGESLGVKAKINTATPIIYLDIHLQANGQITQVIPAHYNALVYVIKGSGTLGKTHTAIKTGQVAIIDTDAETDDINSSLSISTADGEELHVLLLAGQPLKQPIARYGPFVMNTQAEIEQAFDDYQQGRMGKLEGSEERTRITDKAKRTKEQRLERERQQQGTQNKQNEL